MAVELPKVIADYFAADRGRSADAVSSCFTEAAVVKDEGETYNGRDAIRQWMADSSTKYTYVVEPFSIETKGERTVVKSHLVGNFPGSPVDLRYAFVLEADRIAELEIIPMSLDISLAGSRAPGTAGGKRTASHTPGASSVPEIINRRIQELGRAAKMLAVIGAALKLRSSEVADPAIREQIDIGVDLALGDSIATLDDAEIAPLLVMAEMAFAESGELLRNPDRALGWKVEDPELLQAMGRASSNAFSRILALAETRPSLRETLDGTFLDVGTGVGGIALKAAESCPDLKVEAIDVWEPALAIAERNVAASPHAERIRLSHLDVTELEPGPRYTLVWLPTMFMARSVLEKAVDRIAAASLNGAWLVAPLYTKPQDPFTAVMSTLRTLRSGGEVVEASEIETMLRSRGYVDVEVDTAPLATFVLGRLP